MFTKDRERGHVVHLHNEEQFQNGLAPSEQSEMAALLSQRDDGRLVLANHSTTRQFN